MRPNLVSAIKQLRWSRIGAASRHKEQSGVQIRNDIGTSSLRTIFVDEEIAGFEGEERTAFIRHRKREQRLRDAKVREAQKAGSRLACETRGCGFDFEKTYGEPGKNYCQVHHLKPLSDRATPALTKLSDLAIVCANCHAMIHRGGKCRSLNTLI
jgi:predicted HNH restriction endonuclease